MKKKQDIPRNYMGETNKLINGHYLHIIEFS